MTPAEQLAIISNLMVLLKAASSWPFGVVLILAFVGPWVLQLILYYLQQKQYREMKTMYENNVQLVETNEKLAGDLKEVVIMNTQAITRLDEGIRGNQFCPMIRLEKKAQGVQG